MKAIKRIAASTIALSALSPLHATLFGQSPAPAPTLFAETSTALRPSTDVWASLSTSEFMGPVFASHTATPAAVLPAVSSGFSAIVALPCAAPGNPAANPETTGDTRALNPCLTPQPSYARFLDSPAPVPLTPLQKARLALHDIKDPGNIASIINTSAFTIATNAHTAYGPGWHGFASNVGYSFVQDATGEFFGTFLIPSLTHEDSRYHRMPHAGIPRRIVHAVAHTFIAQSDTGAPIPNYSTILTYPICDEISNLYVPGIHGNGPSTVQRILTGYATDPVDNIISEFLPDVARRIHVRVIFAQGILNQLSSDQYTLP